MTKVRRHLSSLVCRLGHEIDSYNFVPELSDEEQLEASYRVAFTSDDIGQFEDIKSDYTSCPRVTTLCDAIIQILGS